MVGSHGGGCAATQQCLGCAFVRTEPPSPERRLVDRTANEGVAESIPSRNVGLPNEIELQKLVECLERGSLRYASCRRGQVWVKRISGNRSALQNQAVGESEKSELLPQRGRYSGWDPYSGEARDIR